MAKRIAVGIVGLLGITPVLLLLVLALREPTVNAITQVAIFSVGSTIGPFLLTRLDRWDTMKQGNRIGGMFILSYLLPPLLLAISGFPHVEDSPIVAIPLAVGVTGLWWSLWGHRFGAERSAT